VVACRGPPRSAYEDGIGIVIRIHDSLVTSAEQHGLRLTSACAERNVAASTRTVTDLMAAEPDVTAVLALDDSAIAGVLNGLRSIHCSVPADVSVIGLLVSPQVAEMAWPKVTTVSHDPRDLGRLAALAMIDALDGASAGTIQVLLPSELARRSTTAPAPVGR